VTLTPLILAEIHRAIAALGGTDKPMSAADARRAVRALGADVDLRSIVDSWQDTLDDEQILELLRNWNAGRPVFSETYASRDGGGPTEH
jgi:hypothetical protein